MTATDKWHKYSCLLWAYRSVLFNTMFKKLSLQFYFCNRLTRKQISLSLRDSSFFLHIWTSQGLFGYRKWWRDGTGSSVHVSHFWALKHVVSIHFGWLHWQLVSFWDSWEIFASAPKALVLNTNSFSLTDCQQAFPCGIVTSDGIVYLMPCRIAILF